MLQDRRFWGTRASLSLALMLLFPERHTVTLPSSVYGLRGSNHHKRAPNRLTLMYATAADTNSRLRCNTAYCLLGQCNTACYQLCRTTTCGAPHVTTRASTSTQSSCALPMRVKRCFTSAPAAGALCLPPGWPAELGCVLQVATGTKAGPSEPAQPTGMKGALALVQRALLISVTLHCAFRRRPAGMRLHRQRYSQSRPGHSDEPDLVCLLTCLAVEHDVLPQPCLCSDILTTSWCLLDKSRCWQGRDLVLLCTLISREATQGGCFLEPAALRAFAWASV